MRLCYIADATSIHTQRWVNYFANKDHEVHLISHVKGEGYINGIQTHILPIVIPRFPSLSKYLSVLMQMRKVRSLVRTIKPDVLNAHHIAANGYLAVASGFHPIVLGAWGSDILIHPKRNPLWKILTRYALNKADCITCDADHMVEAIIKLGASPNKIKLIYFGTDVLRCKPGHRNDRFREKLGLGNSPVVISLRNFAQIYNIDCLINAIPLVLKEVPEAKFVIAGKGPEEVKLKELANSLKVSKSVRFTGFLSQDELPRYLASADIYVSTSLSDAGLAASTAEAMACGLPVVITDFGDNSIWVEEGVNGFLVPPDNPEALASRLIHLFQHKSDRVKFGLANRKIIEERNNYEKEMAKVGMVYEELASKDRNPNARQKD